MWPRRWCARLLYVVCRKAIVVHYDGGASYDISLYGNLGLPVNFFHRAACSC